jgi:undecaprenyl-diphosphatase
LVNTLPPPFTKNFILTKKLETMAGLNYDNLRILSRHETMIDIIIISIIQGISEFLPISSSSHILFFSDLLGIKENLFALEIALHMGTLIAILIYFNKDILQLIRLFFTNFLPSPFEKNHAPMQIIVTSIPIAIVGYICKKYDLMPTNLGILGLNNIVFGGLLLLAEIKFANTNPTNTRKWFVNQSKDLSVSDMLLVGLSQSLAIIPGISRLGACLVVLRGHFFLDIKSALRLGFIMSIAPVFGSILLSLKDMAFLDQNVLIVGSLISCLTGLVTLNFVMHMLPSLKFISIYRIIFGLIVLTKYLLSQ